MKHRMGVHEKTIKCLIIVLSGSLLSMMTIGSLWASPIPDTGQTLCYDNTTVISCPSPGGDFYGQDGNYTINPRSYTKLGQNGAVLGDGVTQEQGWLMTRDNVTGLIWEMKTNDGSSIHYMDWVGTWCDTNSGTNGGDPGTCGSPPPPSDTKAWINAINAESFGGFTDWRMPTIWELSSLVNSGATSAPTIDATWFPNTAPGGYWSSNTYLPVPAIASGVYFGVQGAHVAGEVGGDYKYDSNHARAVRGP
jgi:hypothetical protein